MAARRAGVKDVILPADNEPNVHEDLNKEVLGDLKLHYVKTIQEVVELALEEEAVPTETGKPSRDIDLAPAAATGQPN